MIDKDVAELYGIKETAELNRKVKNNPEKFNNDTYCFDLSKEEKKQLLEEHTRLSTLKHAASIKAYTEYGILMLATTFQKSNTTAIQICHILVQTFVEYKKSLQEGYGTIADSILKELKQDVELLKQLAVQQYEKNTTIEDHFELIFKELDTMKAERNTFPKNEIGFKRNQE